MRQPKQTSTGLFRVYNVTNELTNKPCIWIGSCSDSILTNSSIISLRNATGRIQEAFLKTSIMSKRRFNVMHPIKLIPQIAIKKKALFRGAYFKFSDGMTISVQDAGSYTVYKPYPNEIE